jgi:hypothetical protein
LGAFGPRVASPQALEAGMRQNEPLEPMATYVVTVYRQRKPDAPPDELVGTVETVESGVRTAFRDEAELLNLLREPPRPKRPRKD